MTDTHAFDLRVRHLLYDRLAATGTTPAVAAIADRAKEWRLADIIPWTRGGING